MSADWREQARHMLAGLDEHAPGWRLCPGPLRTARWLALALDELAAAERAVDDARAERDAAREAVIVNRQARSQAEVDLAQLLTQMRNDRGVLLLRLRYLVELLENP